MDDWQTILLAILGGGGLWQLILWLLNRDKGKAEQAQIVVNTKETAVNTEKLAAEKEKVQVETKITAAEYHERTSNDLAAMVVEIKAAMAADKAAATAEIATIRAAQEAGLRQYEERAGNLIAEIKELSAKLTTANETIQTLRETVRENNVTIAALQNEVKAGNEKIANLQDVITNLNQKVTDLMERLLDSKLGEKKEG